MHWIRFSILVFVFAILQHSVIGIIGVTAHNVQPSLYVILLAFVAIHAAATDAVIASFLIGLVADLFGYALGPQLIGFGVVGSLIAELRHVMLLKQLPQQMLTTFVAGVLTATIALLLYPVKGQPAPLTTTTSLLSQSLYSAALYPLVSWPLDLTVGLRRRQTMNP